MVKSLQDIIKGRQHEEFVGREEQLAFFRRNLGLAPEDPGRRFIVSISGQGGVGKTWLLRRFRQIAEESGAVTACSDEAEEDIPAVMGRLSEQFEGQGHKLECFAERYKVYRQRKKEIEADPAAQQEFPAFVGRTLAKGGLHLVRRAPGVGVAAEFVDEEALAHLGGEFASYVARKIKNKDEVRLVLNPVEVLTPLLLADWCEVAGMHTLAIFLDTYERTDEFLDPWLRDLLKGRYGDVPADIVLTIAGRDELDRNQWSPYEGVLTRFPLDPFTEEEARSHLARKGVTDETVIEVILSLSGRLPLLVATLAAQSPDDPDEVGDPSGEAVERFLSWVEDTEQRQAALNAALPRWLNRDVVAVLVGEQKAQRLFLWLKGMPFVEKRGDGWAYHDVVRTQMLRYKRQESPQGWADLHKLLVTSYEGLRDGLGLEEEAGRGDGTWQRYALEALYHSLCYAPQRQLTEALSGFLAALKAEGAFARHWAEVMESAGVDSQNRRVQGWGERLVAGMKAQDADRHDEAAKMYTELVDCLGLEEVWRAEAVTQRGSTYLKMGRYEEALADFSQAIDLDPDGRWAIANRGLTYRLTGRYEEALADYDRAIELEPEYVRAIAERGGVYREMEDFERALTDLNRAMELDPDSASALAIRGETHRLMRCYEEALADFDRAIDLDPDYAWAIASRGQVYQALERYEEALADFKCAIDLNPDLSWVIASRGETYGLMERHEEALADFNRAIHLDPGYAWAIANRGETYRVMDRYDKALADFDRAIELDPDYAWARGSRGKTYALLERHEEALADFKGAIELDPTDTWSVAGRGEVYWQIGRHEEALADFQRALKLDPDYVFAVAHRGGVYREMERYEEAVADFDRAIELDAEYPWALANRGETYRLMERYDEALADFDRAIELDPEYAWAIASRAQVYRALERHEEALADFDRAIELDPEYAWAFAGRGEIHRLMERYDEALADFDQAIELDPDDDWYLYQRAFTRQALGLAGKAQQDLAGAMARARGAYAGDPEDWNNTLNLALYHLAAEEAEEAERHYEAALFGEAWPADIRMAVRDLDDLLSLFPDHPQARAMRDRLQQHLEQDNE